MATSPFCDMCGQAITTFPAFHLTFALTLDTPDGQRVPVAVFLACETCGDAELQRFGTSRLAHEAARRGERPIIVQPVEMMPAMMLDGVPTETDRTIRLWCRGGDPGMRPVYVCPATGRCIATPRCPRHSNETTPPSAPVGFTSDEI